MLQFILGLFIGCVFGIVIMSLANIAATSNDRVFLYRLYNSLNSLYIDCFLADVDGDLSSRISGDTLEEACRTIEDFRKEH